MAKEAKLAEEKKLAEEEAMKQEWERETKEQAAKEAVMKKRQKIAQDKPKKKLSEAGQSETSGTGSTPAVGNKTVDMFAGMREWDFCSFFIFKD